MFSTEYVTNIWIDTIQNAKKTWVDTWVKDEAMSKPLYEFISAQTTFTKTLIKTTNEFANIAGEALAKGVKHG